MDIFIRRLPEHTSRLDLIEFVTEALEPQWHNLEFSPIGKLVESGIIEISDPERSTTEYHGLIHIQPPKAALMVIDRLNGTEINGKRVDVRKYYRRSAERDRRRGEPEILPAEIADQRKQDRRRSNLLSLRLHAGATL